MTAAAIGTTLVLGVGNESRGDDAAGLVVARRVRALAAPGISVRELATDGMLLLEAWADANFVVIVDAASSGSAPGSVHRFDARAPIPAHTLATSTHAIGVTHAIDLGRALNRLPERLVVIGIEGQRFDHGAPLSPPVEAAIDVAVRCVMDEIERMEDGER